MRHLRPHSGATKNVNGKPHIDAIDPVCALPGGEVRILGQRSGAARTAPSARQLRRRRWRRSIISSEQFIVARVPEGAASGEVVVSTNGSRSNPQEVRVAVPIAENLHPVANPAVDAQGNIYVTFSGSRGQKVPVAIYRIDTNYNVKPFLHEMMNADWPGVRPLRQPVCFVALRRHRLPRRAERDHDLLRRRHGRGDRHRVRSRRQSLCRRPQRDHLQDRPRPADLRLRDH